MLQLASTQPLPATTAALLKHIPFIQQGKILEPNFIVYHRLEKHEARQDDVAMTVRNWSKCVRGMAVMRWLTFSYTPLTTLLDRILDL